MDVYDKIRTVGAEEGWTRVMEAGDKFWSMNQERE